MQSVRYTSLDRHGCQQCGRWMVEQQEHLDHMEQAHFRLDLCPLMQQVVAPEDDETAQRCGFQAEHANGDLQA